MDNFIALILMVLAGLIVYYYCEIMSKNEKNKDRDKNKEKEKEKYKKKIEYIKNKKKNNKNIESSSESKFSLKSHEKQNNKTDEKSKYSNFSLNSEISLGSGGSGSIGLFSQDVSNEDSDDNISFDDIKSKKDSDLNSELSLLK